MSQHSARLSLLDLALAPATLRAYNKNLSSFLTHTRLTLQQLLALQPKHIDHLLAGYIQHSYDIGVPYDYASYALNGLIYRSPDLRLCLGKSRLCLRGWQRVKSSASHPPLSWELTLVLAVTMARSGYHAEAVASLLAFHCFLRVGELTRLRICDVVMPRRMGRAHSGMAVCLPLTKTGRNQWVSLLDSAVAAILQHWVSRRSRTAADTDLVFPFSPDHFRQLLRRACAVTGVGHIAYVPHSFRHGGATDAYLHGATIEQIMERGRWKAMESAKRYIQTGRVLLANQRLPQAVTDLGLLFDETLEPLTLRLMASVPLVSSRSTGARRVSFRL